METITYQSFRKEAEEQAKNALEEAISNGATDREKAEEMAREYLHESVDCHEWIIYTGRAWEIVSLIRGADSRLWNEAHDQLTDTDGDKIREGEDLGAVITRLAYWILLCEAESWLSSITIYAAGWNMPGYMPDSDPALFLNFDSAKGYIVEELERYAEEQGQIRNEQIANRESFYSAEQREAECEDGKEWVEKQEKAFNVKIGDYVWWVEEV